MQLSFVYITEILLCKYTKIPHSVVPQSKLIGHVHQPSAITLCLVTSPRRQLDLLKALFLNLLPKRKTSFARSIDQKKLADFDDFTDHFLFVSRIVKMIRFSFFN